MKTYKHKEEQGRGILYKKNEETKAKGVGIGFLGLSLRVPTMYTAQLYAYYICIFQVCVCM